jgi:hypothetical protein
MAILKSEILSKVNSILERSETSIDDELREILRFITSYAPFLRETATGTLTSWTITEPDLCLMITMIGIEKKSYDLFAYNLFNQPFIDVQAEARTGFASRDGVIYVSPKTLAGKDYTIFYAKKHSLDVSDDDCIELGDEFRVLIEDGVIAEKIRSLNMTQQRVDFGGRFIANLQLMAQQVSPPMGTIYPEGR